MNINFQYKYLKNSLWLTGVLAVAFTSCRSDELTDFTGRYTPEEMSLNFKASVMEGDVETYSSRALTQTPFNVEASAFPNNFYIEIWDEEMADLTAGVPDENQKITNPQFETYFVPTSGNGGMLQFKGEPQDTPNWNDIDDQHLFWSWTVPWTNPAFPDAGEDENDDNGTRADETLTGPVENYTPSYTPIKVTLQNTYMDEYTFDEENSEWIPNEGCWQNGKELETFVGAQSGPFIFRKNGPEVPLQFRHLVSKISLRSLLFYGSDGSEHDEFQAEIMFINMPTEFTFYPHPNRTNSEGVITPETQVSGQPVNGAPVAVTNYASANPNGGITYAFTNPKRIPEADMPWEEQSEYRDQFYICPEVDFSQVKYKVTLYGVPDKYTNRGEYWGDFSSIVFQREPGTDYDNPQDPDNPDSYVDDSSVLHAGEVMYFDMIVKQSGGGGGSIMVSAWNNRTRPASHYTHKGMYVNGDANDVAGTSLTWQQKFDLYGDGFYDDEESPSEPSYQDGHLGVFHLYSDVSRGNNTTFPLDANYVVDGMGYTITFEPTSTTTTTITIGKMVDVYLSINGYTVYIDPDGNILKLNPSTGTYMPIGYQIELTGSKSSFTINLEAGTVS